MLLSKNKALRLKQRIQLQKSAYREISGKTQLSFGGSDRLMN